MSNKVINGGARKVVMAGLAGAMALSGVAGVAVPALAATAGRTGSVTITQVSNPDATYDGYRIVKADVNSEDMGARFEWENAATKTAVLSFLSGELSATGALDQTYAQWLTANGHTQAVNGVPARELPQNAIEYIADQVERSAKAQGTNTTPETKQEDSFVDNLAQALRAANLAITGVASTGVAFTGAQGYYLFTTTGATIAADEVGTAPIFVALGDTAKQVTEKAAIPTISKQVKEDKSGAWGTVADANKDQDLDYQLIATLPTNIDAFDTYHVQFNDQLPSGMTLKGGNVSSVKVTYYNGASDTTGTDITDQVVKTYANDLLTVNIADLRGLTLPNGYSVNKDATIKVTYSAHLDADCVIGAAGNINNATLTYTNDPVVLTDGTTTPTPDVKAATYKLTLEKVDHDTRESLAGAKFTLRVADGGQSDAASVGKYVQADGSLGDDPYEFTTGTDGTFVVERIDEGVYTLHETAAPEKYELIDEDITLTIAATKDQSDASITALTIAASGGNGPDFMATPQNGAVAAHQDGVTGANVNTGAMSVRTSDDKIIHLPGTGLTPSQAGIIAGVVMVVAGVGAVVIRQRKVSLSA